MSFYKNFLFLLILGFFILGVFAGGFYFGKSQCEICPPQEIDFSLFWEAYHKLKENFVDKDKIVPQKIIYGAVSGMVKSLGDPYTVFLDPEESKIFQEDVKGYFEGVGMEIGIRKGQLTVIAPLEGTPAQRAGIRSGDVILEVDGTSTVDMTLDEAVRLIRGPKGTKVKLTIMREGWEEPKVIEIVRDVIEIPSLKWELKDGIIYIKIYQFSEKARNDFNKLANRILNLDSKKIILDLRDNPGGYLEVAVDIAGWFLEKDKVVAIEKYSSGAKEDYKSGGPAKFSDYKICVLINKGSASASEILAAALRDNLGVMLIGEKSFGKGSIQKLERLSGGASLKITIAKWLTPKGEQISQVGLKPDIEVKMEEKDLEEERDPQLEKALEILKNL
jgi:carboxyl-terminal processing protease